MKNKISHEHLLLKTDSYILENHFSIKKKLLNRSNFSTQYQKIIENPPELYSTNIFSKRYEKTALLIAMQYS